MTVKFVYVYIFISKFGCLVTPGSTPDQPGYQNGFQQQKIKNGCGIFAFEKVEEFKVMT